MYNIIDEEMGIRHHLSKSQRERDLGVDITNNLKWNMQAKKAANKKMCCLEC